MLNSKKVFTFNQPGHLCKKVFTQVFIFGVFAFLPTGLLAILVRIFSEFRVILPIWESRECKNLQVDTLWVFTRVNTILVGKTCKYLVFTWKM